MAFLPEVRNSLLQNLKFFAIVNEPKRLQHGCSFLATLTPTRFFGKGLAPWHSSSLLRMTSERSFIFVLRKKGNKTKERMKEEEIEKGDCGPTTRKFFFQVQQNLKNWKDLCRPENAPC